MVNIVEKIIAGGPGRRSRLHDAEGNLVDLPGLAFAPVSLVSAVARLVFEYRMPVPWLGYRATLRLAEVLGPDMDVLEFGSGMSTRWLAARVRRVVSIEHDKGWYQHVMSELRGGGVTNVDYVLLDNAEEYPRPSVLQTFDFVLVDGRHRRSCVRTALEVVRPDGWIYLDNSDVEDAAREELVDAANARNWQIERFVDFSPGYLSVTQGILVRAAPWDSSAR